MQECGFARDLFERGGSVPTMVGLEGTRHSATSVASGAAGRKTKSLFDAPASEQTDPRTLSQQAPSQRHM